MAPPQPAEPSEVASLLMQALALHQAGRLAEAEKIYVQILAIDPDQFDARHLLGFVFHQRGDSAQALRYIDLALQKNPDNILALNNRGIALNALKRFDEALASYDRAIAVRLDFLEALMNRGNTLQELRRFDAALASFDRAIAVRPDHVDAYYNRANTLHALKRFDEALTSFDRALALRPDSAAALANRGVTLHALARFEEALASYDAALALWPDSDAVFANRGITLHALKRFEEALASLDRALALRPDNAEALASRGVTLHVLRRFDEALASYDRALELRPDSAEAHSNRGVTLFELRRYAEALASCDRALALQPDFPEALSGRGNALSMLKRFEEASANYHRALALRPDYAEAHTSLGVNLHAQRRFDEALQCYERALAVRPDFAEAHYDGGLSRLLTGDFDRGWVEHEWWREVAHFKRAERNFAQPRWTGSPAIAGKTILLHAEQGFGDTIQFCRYAPRVAALGARVILEVQEALRDLIRRSLDGVAQVVAKGDTMPPFDLHCPFLSLPLAFGSRLETIPHETPYLRASAQAVATWGARLPRKTRPRIGLAWSGRPEHNNDLNRSIDLASFLSPLGGIDATLVSLQREVRAADAIVLRERSDLIHFGEELKDFSDTAALAANMDLVIAVDTSVAHLAGALAKPIWILLPFVPDWRWLLDRDDSPWYPTARLFRQDDSRRWDGVFARLRADLDDFLHRK
jgi:tetratricopeptide (TPR) repeat protein